MYEIRDTICLKSKAYTDTVIVSYGLNDDLGNSLIVYSHHNKRTYFENILTCDICQGRGADGTTYGGHSIDGKIIGFVQNYFNGRDSVFIDFSGSVPTYIKIVRRDYSNEKIKGPDDAGNFLFIAKQKNGIPITKLQLPVDREDPVVKKLFYIKPIKWKKLD